MQCFGKLPSLMKKAEWCSLISRNKLKEVSLKNRTVALLEKSWCS